MSLRGRVRKLRGQPPDIERMFRSPLRSIRLTSVLSVALLVGFPLVLITGMLSYSAYVPGLPGNDRTPDAGPLHSLLLPGWPVDPVWLYRVTQGGHVLLGLALLPIVSAKLWSVVPRLFRMPPMRSLFDGLERLSLAALAGGALTALFTGVVNIAGAYALLGVSFYRIHLFSAWLATGALVVHVPLRLPVVRDALRRGGPRRADPLRAAAPRPGSVSRRGFLAGVGAASGLLVALAVGQSLDGPLRRTALLAPRGGSRGVPMNGSAAERGISAAAVGSGYRLELVAGGRTVARLDRAALRALPQSSGALPIACVEGWSASAHWSGVRLRDLARLAGVPDPGWLRVVSLQASGSTREAGLTAEQVVDPRSLLALRMNGAELTVDHGYPARVIVPGAPGVHCTKWVARLEFHARMPGGAA